MAAAEFRPSSNPMRILGHPRRRLGSRGKSRSKASLTLRPGKAFSCNCSSKEDDEGEGDEGDDDDGGEDLLQGDDDDDDFNDDGDDDGDGDAAGDDDDNDEDGTSSRWVRSLIPGRVQHRTSMLAAPNKKSTHSSNKGSFFSCQNALCF